MNYRPLTRKRRVLGGSSRLWAADDHVLLVTSNLYTETYRRFRLEDIQALVITERPSQAVLQYSVLALLCAFMLVFVLAATSVAGRTALAILFTPFVIASLVDILRGPRARCTLVTAVTQLELPPVSRLRVAEKLVAELAPAIDALQGSIPAEARIPAPPVPAYETPELPKPKRNVWLYPVLFGALLFGTALSSAGFWFRLPSSLTWLPWNVVLLVIVLGGFLVHHFREDGWTSLRVLAMAVAILATADLGASVVAAVQGLRGSGPRNPDRADTMYERSPEWFVQLARIANPAFGVLAIAGLALSLAQRRTEEQ